MDLAQLLELLDHLRGQLGILTVRPIVLDAVGEDESDVCLKLGGREGGREGGRKGGREGGGEGGREGGNLYHCCIFLSC